MKKRLSLLCFLGLSLFFAGCEKSIKKKTKPKIVVSEDLYQLPTSTNTNQQIVDTPVTFSVVGTDIDVLPPEAVEDDGGHVVISPKTFSINSEREPILTSKVPEKVKIQFPTPVSSFASLLIDHENDYQWQPKKRAIRETYGAPWISTQTLSDDKSVFAIVEVMGQEGKANGSRVVLLNTFNSKILRILSLESDLMTQLVIDEEAKAIVSVVKAQEKSRRESAIVIYDILTGKEKKRLKLNSNSEPTCFQYVSKEQKLFLSFPKENQLRVYDLEKNDYKTLPFPEESCFSLDIEANAFIIVDAKEIKTYAIDSLNKISSHRNPLEEPLNSFFMIDDDHYLAATQSSKLYACTLLNPTSALICDNVSGQIFFSPKYKQLFVHMQQGDVLTHWEGTPWRKISELNIRKIHPKNTYPLRFFNYIPAGERVMAFDSQANLVFCAKPKLLWAKKIVVSPK